MTARPKLAHAVLMTNRVAAMRDWYCALLDAEVVYENPLLCFITCDEEHHRLAFVAPPAGAFAARQPDSVGLNHIAFTLPDLATLLERYDTLRARGIEPRVPVQHGMTTSLYYRDPDGQFVELQVDNLAGAAAATAYMHGAEFAADPIGPVYDPARMLADFRAGVPAATLQTRAWALAGGPMPHALELFARSD